MSKVYQNHVSVFSAQYGGDIFLWKCIPWGNYFPEFGYPKLWKTLHWQNILHQKWELIFFDKHPVPFHITLLQPALVLRFCQSNTIFISCPTTWRIQLLLKQKKIPQEKYSFIKTFSSTPNANEVAIPEQRGIPERHVLWELGWREMFSMKKCFPG